MPSPPERLRHSVTSPGTYAIRRCASTASAHGSRPSTCAAPASARSRPSRTRMVVDLPAPLGPRNPWTSPVSTSRSRPSRACVRPNDLWSPETLIAFVMFRKVRYFQKLVKLRNRQDDERRRVRDDRRMTKEAAGAAGPGRDPEAVSKFVEGFAAQLVEAGMQRMPARVFAALLASDSGSLTSAELGEGLRVSPAAVSGAVRYLSQQHMVSREREPGSRRERYRVHGDQWYEALTNREAVIKRWEGALRE